MKTLLNLRRMCILLYENVLFSAVCLGWQALTKLPQKAVEGIGRRHLLGIQQVLHLPRDPRSFGVAEHPQRARKFVRGDGSFRFVAKT